MASALQQHVQTQLDAATADATKENALACALFFAADRKGNTLAHASAGVRNLGESAKLEKDDFFWIASCTKLVTAIACLQLVEQGKLKLDDDASQWATYLRDVKMADGSAPKRLPTVRECLTHTDGSGYPFFNETVNAAFKAQNLEAFSCTKASLRTPFVTQPGTEWEYGTGIDMAGQVVEAITGQTLDQYFKENIFKLLGIKKMTFLPQAGNVLPKLAGMCQRDPTTGVVAPHAHWMEQEDSKIEVHYGGAGLYANAAEYVQILVALLNDGQHPNGGRILSKASVAELFRPQLRPELVKDLERTLYAVTTPQMSNPVVGLSIPGLPKQWSLGGLLTPDGLPPFGRSGKSVWWAGIANNYWWIDHEDGTCGMIQCQLGPFGDPAVIGLWVGLEAEVHKTVQAKA
ncbi:hypothetical protein RQP46_005690 [Phenoliferia psychrophenolica]